MRDSEGLRPGIIQAVMDGSDVLALMPTGGGKSLCYQIPALLKPGICIVVSPLLALMEDQVEDLKSRGIRALSLSGKLKEEDLVRLLDNTVFGKFDLLYLSPERLQQELVLSRLKELPVCLIAIDEAHCISQWGFDFRPAYLKCAVLRELHPHTPVNSPYSDCHTSGAERCGKSTGTQYTPYFQGFGLPPEPDLLRDSHRR